MLYLYVITHKGWRVMMKFKFSHISTGFVAVLVGYASAAAIIFHAASNTGATETQISSWFWALGIGMAATSIFLSWRYKQPIVTAWSTPGAVLLVTALQGVTINEAIAVFLFSSLLTTIVGVSGMFDKLLKHIPMSIASAMLAGVLWPFATGIFIAFSEDVLVISIMLLVYLFGKKWLGNYLIPVILILAIIVCGVSGNLHVSDLEFQVTTPQFMMPDFNLTVMVSVGIPLFVVTMASQNLPGFAVLRANGYNPPASPIITTTGLAGLLLAPFGGFSFNLASLTGAICMSPNADSNPNSRYRSAIALGLFYFIAGVLGTTIVSLFSSIPQTVILAIAGLALLPTLSNCITTSLKDEAYRESSLLTFVMTASSIELLGIGSAFWGLLLGLACYAIQFKQTQQ